MMMRVFLGLLLLTTALACGDDDGDSTVTDGGPIADEDGGTPPPIDAGSELPCATDAPLVTAIPEAGFLVLSTDYASTAIGVVSIDGSAVAEQRWVDSSTVDPGLVAALSGDVALPSDTPDFSVAILDRGNDTVTRICRDGSLVGQVRVGTDSARANPQDAIFTMGSGDAWVSRYEPHPETADELDRGSDLLAFDWTTMTRGDTRIDLSGFGGTAIGLDAEGAETEVAVAARPQAIARALGSYAVVGLSRIPVNLFGADRGHLTGAVALVDLRGGAATLHPVEGLANCGSVAPVGPPDDGVVVVACGGYSNVGFGDIDGERATAGIARLRVSELGEITTEVVWRVADDAERWAAVSGMVPLDEDRVVGVAWGTFGESGDTLVLTRLSDGSQEVLGTASEAFALGGGAFASRSDVLLVPDASSDGTALWRFAVTDDSVTRDGEIAVDDVLPPRSVVAY